MNAGLEPRSRYGSVGWLLFRDTLWWGSGSSAGLALSLFSGTGHGNTTDQKVDTLLICFSKEGAPKPRYSKEDDEWKWQRAASSIEFYLLNEGTWNARRQDKMDETLQLCSKIEDTEIGTPEYDQALNDLMDIIGHFSEFSSACLQVVRERGLLESITPGMI